MYLPAIDGFLNDILSTHNFPSVHRNIMKTWAADILIYIDILLRLQLFIWEIFDENNALNHTIFLMTVFKLINNIDSEKTENFETSSCSQSYI